MPLSLALSAACLAPAWAQARFEQCLTQPSTQVAGFDGSGALVTVGLSDGMRTLDGPGLTQRLPSRKDVPVLRYADGLDALLLLSDTNGDERFRLLAAPFDGAPAKQLSPPGARSATPVIDDANKAAVFSSTAGQGPIWGLLAHPLSADAPHVVFQEGGAWQPMDVSADGQRLLVQQIFGLYDRILYVLDQPSGLKTPLFLGRRPVAIRAATISPDGTQVYAITALFQGGGRLLVSDVYNGQTTVAAVAEWPFYAMALSEDGATLAALENRDGRSFLWIFTVGDDKTEPIATTALGGWASGLQLSSTGESVAVTLSRLGYPNQAVLLEKKDGYAAPLLPTNASACGGVDITRVSLKRPEPIGTKEDLPVKVLLPSPAPQGPLPVLLAFHGGPEGQWRESSHLSLTVLANELGAAIVMPNVVGSTGYGLLYSAGDDGIKRTAVPPDVALTLDYIAQNPALDASRVFTLGASYGGYLAMLSLAQFPERIAGAISEVGISHIPTFLSETPVTRRSLRRREYGDERDEKTMTVLDTLSPLTLAEQVKGPLLLIHGRNDARVLVGQSERMAQRLQSLGKPVTLMTLPDTGHIIRDTQTQLRVLNAKAAFLRAQLNKEGS
ncbi:MAG: prolyl oligopeptidase family serine peptidase [Pseudomonadota bacterium]